MKIKWLLILIIIVAAVLRLYHLNSNPPALSWDEAAIGWNAKTIWETRRDEFGTRLPLSFKSFGDYKAPVYIYLTAPVVGWLGMNEISVRLVSVFSGVASVLLIYLLVKELFPSSALLSALLLSITPWHLLMSRPAFEPNLALLFVLLTLYFFLKALSKPVFLMFGFFSFTLSMYTYHSPKIFLPLLLLTWVWFNRKQLFLKPNRKYLVAGIFLTMVLLWPLVKDTLVHAKSSRFQGTSLFYTREGEKKPLNLSLLGQLAKNYLIHWSPQFLFFGRENIPRIQLKRAGELLLVQAPFLIIGLIYLIKNRRKIRAKLLLTWLLIGPLPAIIGFEVPHPIRAFNWLPALIITSALGMQRFKYKFLIVFLCVINFVFVANHYFTAYPVYSAPDWQYGYKQAVIFAKENEDSVEKILISSHYGQPYIFTLFYQDRDSQAVFWGSMSKYLYRKINWESDHKFIVENDQKLFSLLLIGSPQEIPEDDPGIIKEILFPDGQVAFRIVKTL